MKRILIRPLLILLLLGIAIFCLLPYVLGFVIEQQYPKQLAKWDQPDSYQLTLMSYQRGWFTSHAIVQVFLGSANTAATSPVANLATRPSFMFKQQIKHGPFFLVKSATTKDSRLLFGLALLNSHLDTVIGKIDSIIWVKWNGDFLGSLFSPRLQYRSPPLNLSLSQMALTWQTTRNHNYLLLDAQAPQLVLQTPHISQQATAIKIHFQRRTQANIQSLAHNLFVKEIDWKRTDSNQLPIKLKDLQVLTQQKQDGQKLDASTQANVADVTIKSASYGPQQLQINVHHLDLAAFDAIKQQLIHIQNTADMSDASTQEYQQRVRNLLSKGIEVQVSKFNLITPWGAPTLRARVTFMPQSTTNVPKQFSDLMPAMDAAVQANIPAIFLTRSLEKLYSLLMYQSADTDAPNAISTNSVNIERATQQQITEWVTKKWLLSKDNGYQLNFVYKNQQGVVNGQPWTMANTAPSLK